MVGLIMCDNAFYANQRPMAPQLYDVLKRPIAQLARAQYEIIRLADRRAIETAEGAVPATAPGKGMRAWSKAKSAAVAVAKAKVALQGATAAHLITGGAATVINDVVEVLGPIKAEFVDAAVKFLCFLIIGLAVFGFITTKRWLQRRSEPVSRILDIGSSAGMIAPNEPVGLPLQDTSKINTTITEAELGPRPSLGHQDDVSAGHLNVDRLKELGRARVGRSARHRSQAEARARAKARTIENRTRRRLNMRAASYQRPSWLSPENWEAMSPEEQAVAYADPQTRLGRPT